MSQEIIYQRIGEFVVCFQHVENQLRQIAWFLLDPQRKHWPPADFRDVTSYRLAEAVKCLLRQQVLQEDYQLPSDFCTSFEGYVSVFHRLRKWRNRVLHSAYIELKAGGEVVGLLRSDPILEEGSGKGDPTMDQEFLSESSFSSEMELLAHLSFNLGQVYLSLVHAWKGGE